MPDLSCTRCGQTRAGQSFQPFQNALGKRAYDEICGECWGEWLLHQTALINHHGLNLREPQSKQFLFQQMEEFLFDQEPKER